MPVFGRIGDLHLPFEAPSPALHVPDEFRARYERFGSLTEWRQLTISPDFPRVADLAAQLYEEFEGPHIDGVLTVDPVALAAFLQFTGPIQVPQLAQPLTADNAAPFLLRDQYTDLPDVPGRIDALEDLGRATFDRLTTGDLPSPQTLARTLGPVAAAGNLRLAAFDPEAASFLAATGLDHELPEPTIDALAVTSTNIIGGKMDAFLTRTVDYDARWDPATGAITAVVRVELRNDTPSSGLPDYVIGDAQSDVDYPLGTNRDRLTIFSPWVLDDLTVDGAAARVLVTRERSYYAYEVVVQLEPNGGTALIEAHLAGSVAPGADYRLDVWNQVMANPDQFRPSITVAGTGDFSTSELAQNDRVASSDLVLDRPRTFAIHAEDTGDP
jgi:hypothetical protein